MNALRWMAAGLLVVGLAAAVRAADKPDVSKEKLAGTWEVTKADEGGPPTGAVIEFTKDGKLKVTHTRDGKEETLEGTWTADGAKLTVAVKAKDEERKHTVTVKKLTDTELAVQDEEGRNVEFKRKK